MPVSPKAETLLNAIEVIEMRSLTWGFTEGSLSESEAMALALSQVVTREAADGVLEELIAARLLLEFRTVTAEVRLRSRFAEMVRLLFRLRQLFDKKPWQGAPRLVADFRVDHRPRRFPKRHISPERLLRQYASLDGSEVRRAIWRALTGNPKFRLADFQERAVARLVGVGGDSGTIVTAGTGSGKTLAFYLPALVRIGEAIDQTRWVKAIAIYPRIELLKDQFAEAFRMARLVDGTLGSRGQRSITIGAFFGSTPKKATIQSIAQQNWPTRGADFICPWLRCPNCSADVLWRRTDIERQMERLSCSRQGCNTVISDREIVLTRYRIQREPPDILFTTTETLNQRLSDHWTRSVFGVGVPVSRRPIFALLDEVHTYVGTSGAQAALVLRRWRHLLDAPIVWAGLSATLEEAARFFADLTGVETDQVAEITPTLAEMEERGAEYQLLLRGDPASRTSLLSTTIQTAMLLARTLDPPAGGKSKGAFGRRAFVFTDDLDVTNRLFDNLRDAEAYTIFGKPDNKRVPLAILRGPGADAALRDLEGQRWRMCEDIGHPLNQRLVVSRTTSQDAGVHAVSNVVVATAALEVGFNDPHVGAVIQHKAPRTMASFLQRKGRAGRSTEMRPITVTVLSDYGRDRLAFQAYEHLFDPALPPQHLPIRNLYVLRMQAVFALMDWLAHRTSGPQKAWMWDILSRPLSEPNAILQSMLQKLLRLVGDLARCEPALVAELKQHLMKALGIDAALADSVMWEPPRSLLLEAIPTLARRLVRNWQLAFPIGDTRLDQQVNYHPLPDFVPRNLFSDLNLPEVRVVVPPATVNHEVRVELLPILSALGQLAPGRVTRRFAYERGGLSHWVPVDRTSPVQEMRVSDYASEHEFIGMFRARCNGSASGSDPISVYRPWKIEVEKAQGQDVLPSSNAALSWCSELIANGEPLVVPVPPRSSWYAYIKSVCFHIHRFRASVTARRFSPRVHANVRTLQDDHSVVVKFRSDEGKPAAIGFEMEVDGFYLDLVLPGSKSLSAIPVSSRLTADARLAYLRSRFVGDAELPEDLNIFQREWILHLVLSAVVADVAVRPRPLATAGQEILSDANIGVVLGRVLDELFQAIPPQPEDDDEADSEEDDDDEESSVTRRSQATTRLNQALRDQLDRTVVRDRIRKLATEFDVPDAEGYSRWLRATIAETMGEALLQSCIAAAPRHATIDTLLVDFEELDESTTRIWITESTLGGAGVLEAFAEQFVAEPRMFFNALEAALAPTDLELAGEGMGRFVGLVTTDQELASQVARLRAAVGHNDRAERWRVLSTILADRGGMDLGHAFVVSLNSRLLRPGSSPTLDRLVAQLLARWDTLEQQCGVAVGLREFAYACSKDEVIARDVRSFLATILSAAGTASVDVLAVISGLLWPRGWEIRQRTLQSRNPFRRPRVTDPGLVRAIFFTGERPEVEIGTPDWRPRLTRILSDGGIARLSARPEHTHALRQALVEMAVTPIDVGYLQFYPVVERIERENQRTIAILVLREQV